MNSTSSTDLIIFVKPETRFLLVSLIAAEKRESNE